MANSTPRPEEALARRLRGMQDTIRSLVRSDAAKEARIRVLESRLAELDEEGGGS